MIRRRRQFDIEQQQQQQQQPTAWLKRHQTELMKTDVGLNAGVAPGFETGRCMASVDKRRKFVRLYPLFGYKTSVWSEHIHSKFNSRTL